MRKRPRKPLDQRGGRLKPNENITEQWENHTKTIPKADGPTRETMKTIRKPYKPIGKPYENDPESRWTNEGTIKNTRKHTKPLEKHTTTTPETLENHVKTIRKSSNTMRQTQGNEDGAGGDD